MTKRLLLVVPVVALVFAIISCSKSSGPTGSNTTVPVADSGWVKTAYNMGYGTTPARVFFVGSNMYAASLGLYRSSDSGATWAVAFSGVNLNLGTLGVFPIGNTLYDGTPYGAYRSTDNGATWKLLSDGIQAHTDAATSFLVNGNTLLMSVSTGGSDPIPQVYGLTNGSDTWVPMSTGLPLKGSEGGAFLMQAASTIYVRIGDIGWFKSGSGGTQWDSGAVFPVDVLYPPIVQGGGLYLLGAGDYGDPTAGMYISADGGNWTPGNSIFANHTVHSIAASGGKMFAEMNDKAKLFFSQDAGTSWRDVTGGITDTATSVCVLGNYLYVGTYDKSGNGGLWRRLISTFK